MLNSICRKCQIIISKQKKWTPTNQHLKNLFGTEQYADNLFLFEMKYRRFYKYLTLSLFHFKWTTFEFSNNDQVISNRKLLINTGHWHHWQLSMFYLQMSRKVLLFTKLCREIQYWVLQHLILISTSVFAICKLQFSALMNISK